MKREKLEEQKEKMQARQTPKERIAPARDTGIELPDEMLEAVAGGSEPAAAENTGTEKKPAIKRKGDINRH